MTARFDMDRDTLFEEVWQSPMIEVGKKYGVCRPAVKWACQQLEVPLPPQAYWAHLRAGRVIVERPELPPISRGKPARISRVALALREPPKRIRRRLHLQRQAEITQRAIEEQIRYDELISEVEDWHRAEEIRRYIAELKRLWRVGGKKRQGFDEWCTWAEGVAADLDRRNLRISPPS